MGQASQGCQVEAVQVASAGRETFGGFEDEGATADAPVGQETAEGGFAQLALADVVVAVEAAVEIGFGIVGVDNAETVQADGFVEQSDGVSVTVVGAEIVAGGEDVAGVEADAKAVGRFDSVDDAGEVFEGVAEGVAGAGGGFEQDFSSGGDFFEDTVQGGADLVDALDDAPAAVGAGVEYKKVDVKKVATAVFVEKGGEAFSIDGSVGCGGIDQIAAVGDNGIKTGLAADLLECVDLGWDQWGMVPLSLISDEELNTLAAQFLSRQQGVMESARNGKVGAKGERFFFHFQ